MSDIFPGKSVEGKKYRGKERKEKERGRGKRERKESELTMKTEVKGDPGNIGTYKVDKGGIPLVGT